MLIKMIKCQVNENSRKLFHLAQTKWTELQSCRGFVAQLGGWNLLNKEEAVIIGVWESSDAYSNFMDKHHDKLLNTNEQMSTYQKIEVSLWDTHENINCIDVKYYAFIAISETGNCKRSVDDDNKAEYRLQINNNNSTKTLMFNVALQKDIAEFEAVVKLEAEWAVLSNS
ncbi:hypothetical protein PAECIP112173_00823 [Paenibacillus sp. JJ-100]|uniref:DUF4937 domain-containing protein n=1 Tax=Paenibacillus sp. JJ-100 TaxID=2974896 RepID=UPI0022FFADCE|nr:DUF4937 domain-containing protein [Paenibacillus sp. JJ-100]CAI6036049.1 hypothetical protein PAECIP112173_00823 [Paenibacillus sp. JJ-100]